MLVTYLAWAAILDYGLMEVSVCYWSTYRCKTSMWILVHGLPHLSEDVHMWAEYVSDLISELEILILPISSDLALRS